MGPRLWARRTPLCLAPLYLVSFCWACSSRSQGSCKIGKKRGSKGQPPLCGGLGASPSLFFSRARRAQKNFAPILLSVSITLAYSFTVRPYYLHDTEA